MFIPTATPNRPCLRLHCAIYGLSLCAILSFTIILDDDFPLPTLTRRRRLASLNTHPVKPFPYGRDLVDPNYQSLVQPSDIDGSLIRKQAKRAALAEGATRTLPRPATMFCCSSRSCSRTTATGAS